MRESLIEKKVCDYAKTKGMLPLKFTPVGTTGYPDRIILCKGGAAFIEFKTLRGVPSPIQLVRIRELEVSGFRVAVVRTVEDGKRFIDGL